jgi:hypothetical protein
MSGILYSFSKIKFLVGRWLGRVDPHFFVVNVNVNDDGNLNANVNQFENDNVWNGVNQHHVIVPVIYCSPALRTGGSFRFKASPPAADHFADLFELFRQFHVFFVRNALVFPGQL